MIKSISVIIFLFISTFGWSQSNDSTLSILSWNVFLRPVLSDNQKGRVDSICDYLLNSNADVLILQEAFHHKTRKRLLKSLSSVYKHHTSIGPQGFFRISSGVLIFSKKEITSEEHITYKKAKGIDGISKKGGVDITIEFLGRSVNIIGTHLQAGGGEKRDLIRKSQFNQLVNEESNSDITLYAGDFNIRFGSERYLDLCQTLQVHSDPISGKNKWTANFNDHDLFDAEGSPEWIDFILLKNDSDTSSKLG